MATKTSASGSEPYASPADYLARVDVGLTGDLVRDDGTRASPAQLLTDPNLAAALADASGMVEAEALASGRYTAADLQALAGNSEALLKRIVCGLAVQCLRWRRGIAESSEYPLYAEALKWLEALHEGRAIFAFSETINAGLPVTERMQPFDYLYNLPTLVTNNSRYWGLRANRRGGPGGTCGGYPNAF